MATDSTGFWLMKTEPDEFGLEDLRKKGTARWDGVRNYQARNSLRAMQVGDTAFIYHSSCAEPGVAGLATVAVAAYPDPSQFDPASPYADPRSPHDEPRWSAVDVRFVRGFRTFVPLSLLRERRELEGLILLRPGTRLSVIPVSAAHAKAIIRLGDGS